MGGVGSSLRQIITACVNVVSGFDILSTWDTCKPQAGDLKAFTRRPLAPNPKENQNHSQSTSLIHRGAKTNRRRTEKKCKQKVVQTEQRMRYVHTTGALNDCYCHVIKSLNVT